MIGPITGRPVRKVGLLGRDRVSSSPMAKRALPGRLAPMVGEIWSGVRLCRPAGAASRFASRRASRELTRLAPVLLGQEGSIGAGLIIAASERSSHRFVP